MKNRVNSFKFLVGAIVFMAICFVLNLPVAFSQEDCTLKLKKAQELFESGHIEEIPTMFDACLNDGFNKEQTIQAYRLLIQVYLFDYNHEKAEKAMLDLLSRYPEYKTEANDPVEFVNLYKQFYTRPTFSISANSGINMSNIYVIEEYSTGSLSSLNSEHKPAGIKPSIGISFEKYLNAKTWVTLGIGYSMAGYEVNESMNFGREMLTFSEKMQYAHVPLSVSFSFWNSRRINPYVFAGGQFSYLIQSKGKIILKNVDGAASELSESNTDITNTRNKENISALGGIGVQFKIPTGYLKANLYYTKSIIDHVNDNFRFSNTENIYHYNYIDDRIKLDFINFSLSYSYVFYKTSKREIAETNSL